MENEVDSISKKAGKKIIGGAVKKYVIIALAIILIIALLIIGFKFSSNFISSGKSVKLGFENVGKLVTQECYITRVEDSEDNVDFFKLFDIPFTKSRQIFSYNFKVNAVVNFEKIKYNIDDNKKEIIITLPHAEVADIIRDEDSLKVYLDQGNLFSRIDLKEQSKASKKMEEEAVRDCEANGFLENADKNAKTLIGTFIKSEAKYKNYNVTYSYVEK